MQAQALEQSLVQLLADDKVAIPAYPAIALELKRLTEKQDANFDEIVQLVLSDQAIAATVLRWANAASTGVVKQTSSLQESVKRLGLKAIGQIAITAALGQSMLTPGPLDTLKFLLWRRAVLSSLVCHELAQFRHIDKDLAFTAGLLHDLGQSVALAALEQLATAGADQAWPPEQWEALSQRFHIEMGMVVAARWQLPDDLATVMARHHDVKQTAPLLPLVHIADAVNQILESKAALSLADLAPIAGFVDDKERNLLVEFVPSAVDLLTVIVEPPSQTPEASSASTKQPAPLLLRVPQLLHGQVCPVSLPAVVRKNTGDQSYQVVALGGDGLLMLGPQPIKENGLEKICLQEPEREEFLFCISTKLCQREEDGTYRIEAKPFGLGGNAKIRWRELYQRLVQCPELSN